MEVFDYFFEVIQYVFQIFVWELSLIACGCAAFMRLRRRQGLLTRATDSAVMPERVPRTHLFLYIAEINPLRARDVPFLKSYIIYGVQGR